MIGKAGHLQEEAGTTGKWLRPPDLVDTAPVGCCASEPMGTQRVKVHSFS